MSDVAGFGPAMDAVGLAFGGIDILVNNAGIMVEHHIDSLTVSDWDRVVAINTRAPVFLTQAVLPHMRRRGGGSPINVGSIEGLSANPQHTAYAASKAAVHGLTRALALDLGADGIRCNTIVPGWIVSELSDRYLSDHPDAETTHSELLRLHPVGRLGARGDAAVFLAGDRLTFMTRQIMVVDGGRTSMLPMP